MKTKTLIGLALLVAAIHGGGCGKEPYIGGDIDELALGVPAEAQGERPTFGEPRYFGDRFRDEPAPLKASTSSRVKAWWARVVAAIRAAIEGDSDTPADPVTPVPDPVTPPPVPAGDNSFLWKPVSESRGGRCAVITPANLTVAKVLINGANHTAEYAGRANGNRQHFFQDATGAAYGNAVKVQALNAAGVVLRSWTVPNGGARWGSQ